MADRERLGVIFGGQSVELVGKGHVFEIRGTVVSALLDGARVRNLAVTRRAAFTEFDRQPRLRGVTLQKVESFSRDEATFVTA